MSNRKENEMDVVFINFMTEKRFEERKATESLPANEILKVVDVDGKNGQTFYAWSPDGIGCFYYDTLEELRAEHF